MTANLSPIIVPEALAEVPASDLRAVLRLIEQNDNAGRYQRRGHRFTHKFDKTARTTFVADFETTTTAGDCRVWGWGMVAVPEDWRSIQLESVEVGTDLSSFMEQISAQQSVCYFHNLRFDGRFILDWLLAMGYRHRSGTRAVAPGEFQSLISDLGAFYSITVRWPDGGTTEFRDSAKKLPMTVKRIAESFHMEHEKGEIDYDAPRPRDYIPTDIERDYIRRDCFIVARAVGQQLADGMKQLTIGADALHEYQQMLGGPKQFRRLFPVLSLDLDAEIRRAYRGGFTYADPRYKGRLCGAGMVFDVNSLYPSVMYTECLPYGEPEPFDGRPQPTRLHPLTIFEVTFEAKIKPDHIPCIQVKNNLAYVETEYLSEVNEPTTLWLTNVDWDLINDHYDVDVLAWGGGYRFRGTVGLFRDYIDKYMQIKANSIGGVREIAKLFLNSLYGKFATRPDVTGKVPYHDEQGVVRFKTGPNETRDPIYTPAGVFITAYARNVTIRAAQHNYRSFAYADTDSLHLLSNQSDDNSTFAPEGIRVHAKDLGSWKHELDFCQAYYIRAKAYLEQDADGNYHNAIAGIPVPCSAALTFEDLRPGNAVTVSYDADVRTTHRTTHSGSTVLLHGKLIPKAVPGGVILVGVPYELKLA